MTTPHPAAKCGWCLTGDHAHHRAGGDGWACSCQHPGHPDRHRAALYACLLCGGAYPTPDHVCPPERTPHS